MLLITISTSYANITTAFIVTGWHHRVGFSSAWHLL